MIPAGAAGSVTLAFESNALYRGGLAGGLALLPLLLLLALVPVRRPLLPDEAARPRRPGRWRPGWECLRSARYLRGGRRRRGGGGLGTRYLLRARLAAVRRGHGRDRGGWADTGRRGVVAESMAIGRRVRRPLGGRSAAGADLGGRAGGVGGHDSGAPRTPGVSPTTSVPREAIAPLAPKGMKVAGKALPKRLNRLRRRRARCGAPDLDAAGAGRLHGDHVVDGESHPGATDDVAPLLVSAEYVPDDVDRRATRSAGRAGMPVRRRKGRGVSLRARLLRNAVAGVARLLASAACRSSTPLRGPIDTRSRRHAHARARLRPLARDSAELSRGMG